MLAPAPDPRKPKLLERVREVIRFKHYSLRTERTYLDWIKRFIVFHGKRHPAEMGAEEVRGFLSDLASVHRRRGIDPKPARKASLTCQEQLEKVGVLRLCAEIRS